MEDAEIPHLTLRTIQKLNPKAVFWRWIEDGWLDGWGGRWQRTMKPRWLKHCIYATTASPEDPPTWTPTDEQLKASKRLKRSFEAGKKLISQPEMSPSSP